MDFEIYNIQYKIIGMLKFLEQKLREERDM